MSKLKLLSIITAVCAVFSALPSTSLATYAAETDQTDNETSVFATYDAAIANDEKIIEKLKKDGTIPSDTNPDKYKDIIKKYLKEDKNENSTSALDLDTKSYQGLKSYAREARENGLLSVHDSIFDKLKPHKPQTSWDGSVTKDKALVLLIEFPDLPHNTLTAEDTDMYYKDYTNKHYNDMIFGKDGYTGPNGENLMSMKQFYDQQSGGSYDIEGTVLGWYTAKHPAAYYGADQGGNHNIRADELIKEALEDAAKDIDLSQFDLKDPYDLNGDGNIQEPDGIIDHLMVIHSGMGQEAGGGSIGDDSIWSHSSKIYQEGENGTEPWKIPGTDMSAYPYTIMPEDGAAGVFAHEFGHDLGLPDEYDTQYSGEGESIEYWSIMSSGSWAGKIPGAEPTGFSPYAKEYFQKTYGGNWFHGNTIDYSELGRLGTQFTLDAASKKGKNNNFVKITLPDKSTVITTPVSGEKAYFSGSGNNLNNSMITDVDLTNVTTDAAVSFDFKAWYDIEKDWDYGSVGIQLEGENKWTTLPGNITTTENPNEQNPGNGITGKSDGWVDAKFDLKDYIGKKFRLRINYWTDVAAELPGLYVDDISLNVNDQQILFDDCEGNSKFELDGFSKNDGKKLTDHYYLIELRNHYGSDSGLKSIKRGKSLISYDPGLLIWYVDNLYTENWTGTHPGHGFLGVVDSDQTPVKWNDGTVASSRFQVHDAAFSFFLKSPMIIDYSTDSKTQIMKDYNILSTPVFKDSNDYTSPSLPDAGMILPQYGIKVNLLTQSPDSSRATISVTRK